MDPLGRSNTKGKKNLMMQLEQYGYECHQISLFLMHTDCKNKLMDRDTLQPAMLEPFSFQLLYRHSSF